MSPTPLPLVPPIYRWFVGFHLCTPFPVLTQLTMAQTQSVEATD